MTSSNFKKIGSKLFLTLTILCLLCMSIFYFAACKETETTDISDPTYSYTETDEGLLTNGSFNIGTSSLDFSTLSSLPRTSVNGWSKSSSASDVNSGIIDVSDDAWKQLISKLYDDSDFLAYAEKTFGFDKDDIKEELKGTSDSDPTSSEIKEKIIADYFTDSDSKTNHFPNPKTHADALDTKLYMLNNYDKDKIGHGVSQYITSSSTFTLEKGNYGKFTVWVKTHNLTDWNPNTDFGAYIGVKNTFNGTSQAQYKIENIISNSWKQFTIYVKADAVYDTSVTLVLGLGQDSFNAVEGSVFFDDITFEHVDSSKFSAVADDTKTMIYGDTSNDIIASSTHTTYLYDMTLNEFISNKDNETIDDIADYLKADNTVNIDDNYTSSNTGAVGNSFGMASVIPVSPASNPAHKADTVNAIKVDLDKASYTLTIKSNNFNVEPESYTYIETYVKNELSKFGSSLITFDVFEDLNGNGDKNDDGKNKTSAVASVSETSDSWTKVGIMLKNNFTTGNRKFIIDIVIGPVDVATALTAPEYATGSVTISTPFISNGKTTQYDDNEQENDNFVMYSLLNSTANGSVALFGGMQQDYVEDSSSTSYSLNYAASDIGAITYRPANLNNYTGVVANHAYVMNENEHDNLETNINDRVNGKNGSYAGLINTKYVNNYALAGINDALNHSGKDDIQPLMIYNATADSYGYIGSENSIAPSSYAKISIKTKVVGDAVAYIYLVDVSAKSKDVMIFDEDNIIFETSKELSFKITSDLMNDDGWATVNFYIATGATTKNFRLEVWNGDRTAQNKSQGFIFFNDISVSTSGAFSEPTKLADTFTVSGNPLYEIGENNIDKANLKEYTRKLTDLEKEYNGEQTDSSKLVSYSPSYIWANNDTNIYAIFNTIDAVENDPYAIDVEEEETDSGCIAKTDPSTFWMSFSSILLAAVLVLAIIMLIVKNVRRRRKARASDAKSHYTITSRVKTHRENKIKQQKQAKESYSDEVVEDISNETDTNTEEQSNDDYIYGDVQDFGDEDNNN